MDKKISVCMAVYNGERFIKEQVASILTQLSPDDEILVVDDTSSDNTIRILEGYQDARIKITRNSKNIGSNASFQKALSLASGDFIFLSDQDDVWYPHKVETALGYLQTHDLDLLVHDARVIDVIKNSIISESLFELYRSSPGLVRNLISSRHTGCCTVIRSKALDKILPIPLMRGVQHDAWIGALSSIYRLKKEFLAVPLIDYNRHDLNTSPLIRTQSLYHVFVNRLFLISFLILRVLTGGFKHIRLSR